MKYSKLITIYLLLFSTIVSFSQGLEIYVCDAGNFNNGPWKILKYDENGENPITYIDTLLAWPQDIVFIEDQDIVLISNFITGKIIKYDISTGDYVGNFATAIGGPTRMKIGSDNLLYVLQYEGNEKVLRYELDGTFFDEFTEVGVPNGVGIDWDSQGNLYVSSYLGGIVQKFDTSGNDLGVFIDDELSGPTNIWFDDNDYLFVMDFNNGDVKRFDFEGNYIDTFISGLSQIEGVAFLPNGNILIGNGGFSQVDQFLVDGTFLETTIASGKGGLIQPNAVVLRESALSIEDYAKNEKFLTPTVGSQFYINYTGFEKRFPLQIYNSSGQLVDNILINESSWNADHLTDGVYFVVLSDPTFSSIQKIIIKK